MKDILEYNEDELNWTFGEVLVGLVKKPRLTFRYLLKKRTGVVLAAIYLIYVLLHLWAKWSSLNGPESWGVFTGSLLGATLATILMLLFFSFLVKLLAKMFNFKGTLINTIKVITIAFLPVHFVLWFFDLKLLLTQDVNRYSQADGFLLIGEVFPGDVLSFILKYAYLVLFCASFIYSLVLFTTGLSEAYKTSMAKTIVILIISAFVAFVIPVIFTNINDILRLFA